MFPDDYFGIRFFGDRYFGEGGASPPSSGGGLGYLIVLWRRIVRR